MKNIEKYYKGSNDYINAYEKADINKHKSIFEEAQKIWFNTWSEQGSVDEGSCCGGKGLQVFYVAPRCRSAKPLNIVDCNFVQGNISAQLSSKKALDFLKSKGIEATYNDGWLD